jgi:hypothetical protein
MEDKNSIVQDNNGLDEILDYDGQFDEFEEAVRIKDFPEIAGILNDYIQKDTPLPVKYVCKLVELFQPNEPSDSRGESKNPGPKRDKRRLIFRNLEIARTYISLCDSPKFAAQFVNGTDWERFNSEMPYNERNIIIIPPMKYWKKNPEKLGRNKRTQIKDKIQERVGLGRTRLEDILTEWGGYLRQQDAEERKILNQFRE